MIKRKEKSYRLPCVVSCKNRNDAENIFLHKNELEILVTNGNFEMMKSEKLSKLPEYIIVIRKRE